MYKSFFKRIIDVFVAFFGLLLLSPIFLIITLSLFFTNQGKPFFFQDRPGKYARIFKLIKFKTMTDEKDSLGNLLSDEKRLTKFGKFIRSTSIDELPQLVNVFVGEMSFIGPRPLLPDYLPYYNDFQRQRHIVRPGITGWAQVNGRNAINWSERFELDVWYVKNLSFKLDIYILTKTLMKIISPREISATGNLTMPRFDK